MLTCDSTYVKYVGGLTLNVTALQFTLSVLGIGIFSNSAVFSLN